MSPAGRLGQCKFDTALDMDSGSDWDGSDEEYTDKKKSVCQILFRLPDPPGHLLDSNSARESAERSLAESLPVKQPSHPGGGLWRVLQRLQN